MVPFPDDSPPLHRFLRWRDTLHGAHNVKAVSAVMHDYVNTVGVPLISTLPVECQKVLTDPNLDVQSAAVTLLHAEHSFSGSDEVRELLHEMAQTFAAASVRVSALHGRPGP